MRYTLTRDKFLSPGEQLKLEQSCKLSDRNGLLILTALKTGARAQELLNVKKSDLDNGSIYIRGLKGSDDRLLPVAPELYGALKALNGPGQHLFGISYARLWQIWDYYKPGPKTFHSLRHTFAMNVYQKTKDVYLLQRALGHRSLNNTMIYMNYSINAEEMRRNTII